MSAGCFPRLLTVYGKIDRALAQLHYFLQRTWKVWRTHLYQPHHDIFRLRKTTDMLTHLGKVYHACHDTFPPRVERIRSLFIYIYIYSSFLQNCFLFLQWSHDNHDKLLSVMSEEDKRLLNFDMRTLDWPKYVEFFCMGTKKYLMKEDLANLPAARRQITR